MFLTSLRVLNRVRAPNSDTTGLQRAMNCVPEHYIMSRMSAIDSPLYFFVSYTHNTNSMFVFLNPTKLNLT